MVKAFGINEAFYLWHNVDADTLDGLIHQLNQINQPPEQRVSDYVQRCAKEHFEQDPQALEQFMRIG